MNNKPAPAPIYTPMLTTEAGSCLTLANWQETGTTTVSYQLESLLLKPGFSLLKELKTLKSYVGWQNKIVLNASLPPNKQGIYSIRSPYDGSVLRIAQEEICSLINQLQPDMVILPADIDLALSTTLFSLMNTFIVPNEKSSASGQNYGWYLSYELSSSFESLQKKIETYQDKPIYLSGNFDLSQWSVLTKYNSLYVESDLPAQNAMLGKVYSEGKIIDLHNDAMTHQQIVIDKNCSCPVCQQMFTRAYFHHLISQTPLLCQRFLIQHNVYYYQNYGQFL
ncbi:queuine tRNA-ribosyltransferase [Legionella cardiaca]|uniref:Queuine tRNA-ribosyltransferase n=1 Tax=Legionella cardiaca TaxID=1071983 RepID=A0ABY8ARA3_9GAMM|nr:queuine tRNA-ribosyltransferase [Legionella cardiaca]WED42055.1 queuine tRNA-ribosyltransferase [Legionella cardiaca]